MVYVDNNSDQTLAVDNYDDNIPKDHLSLWLKKNG